MTGTGVPKKRPGRPNGISVRHASIARTGRIEMRMAMVTYPK
jgi:hypothetical protein